MHELFLIKVPEILDTITKTTPITIMTRFPMGITTVAGSLEIVQCDFIENNVNIPVPIEPPVRNCKRQVLFHK